MAKKNLDLDALQDIRNIMERSSRFISLSGWSGVSAGCAALIGAFLAKRKIDAYSSDYSYSEGCATCLRNELITIAAVVFVVALAGAFFFTYVKAKKEGVAIWGTSSRRLLWNTILPMAVGGIVILRMIILQYYELVASVSLIFYGLALINGSKYTVGEVKYLGYAIIITGVVGLWLDKAGLYTWAFGFGILHIVYGIAMWLKYDKKREA